MKESAWNSAMSNVEKDLSIDPFLARSERAMNSLIRSLLQSLVTTSGDHSHLL